MSTETPPECPLCSLPVTPEVAQTLSALLDAFGLLLNLEPDDPAEAGFARFMARGRGTRDSK